QENKTASSIEKISLDDKFLLTYFDSLVKENNIDEVKKFAFILLKTRFLFDLYVVKTDSTEKEHWSLKMPQYDTNNSLYYKNTFDNSEKEQDCVLMILSMFHTSYPSRNYKNWLYAVLRGLVLNEWSKKYLEKLEILSDRFYFNIYQNSQDFFDVIYNEPDILDSPNKNDEDTEILHCGVNVPHFIFNRLDYLLWKKEQKHKEFRFTFRGSVEHYYPQNPLDGIPSLDKKVLDNFGNLCLVSREKNAKLSNHTPEAKKDYYLKSGKYDSLKQKRMMESSSWGKNYILAHSAEMIKILNQKTPYSTVS
ncbi:TPA: HNH endonuclease, partial [Pasteurella multocida]|nr:HNH endonuclease [Pasteurella multocida]